MVDVLVLEDVVVSLVAFGVPPEEVVVSEEVVVVPDSVPDGQVGL